MSLFRFYHPFWVSAVNFFYHDVTLKHYRVELGQVKWIPRQRIKGQVHIYSMAALRIRTLPILAKSVLFVKKVLKLYAFSYRNHEFVHSEKSMSANLRYSIFKIFLGYIPPQPRSQTNGSKVCSDPCPL